jgi:hypothetical protein
MKCSTATSKTATQVRVDHGRLLAVREQRTRVRDDDRVVVDVYDPRLMPQVAQHFAGASRRRDPRSDVEELANPLARQKAHRAAEERAIGDRHVPAFGQDRQHLPGGFAVGGEMRLAAEVVVVHARRVRDGDVDVRRFGRVLLEHLP